MESRNLKDEGHEGSNTLVKSLGRRPYMDTTSNSCQGGGCGRRNGRNHLEPMRLSALQCKVVHEDLAGLAGVCFVGHSGNKDPDHDFFVNKLTIIC